jgi:hypothetical protein
VSERDEEMKEIPLIPTNIRVDGVLRWMNKASQILPQTESTLKLPFPFPFLCTSYALKRDFSTVGRWRDWGERRNGMEVSARFSLFFHVSLLFIIVFITGLGFPPAD